MVSLFFFCLSFQLSQSNQAENAALIFDTLVDYLCSEHIDYALEIGLQGIASHEPKVQPQTYFFDIGSQANAIFHLLEKQFSDVLVPLIRYVMLKIKKNKIECFYCYSTFSALINRFTFYLYAIFNTSATLTNAQGILIPLGSIQRMIF